MKRFFLLFLCFLPLLHVHCKVQTGADLFFKEGHYLALKGKRIGLLTNQTGVDSHLHSTLDLLLAHSEDFSLVALFAPEHGLQGVAYAEEEVASGVGPKGIPIHSLHGKTRRPTAKMLEGIDVLIYDIQDIGSRTYTYATTLYYLMEEAARRKIEVVVLDRPNPINGTTVDGPMLNPKWRSFIGYVNVPYCHGMTIGELARFFNAEYRIGCALKVILMRGWKRTMSFKDTGLPWIPTSPNIPEADTPFFYASTGILGALNMVDIGLGYTLPFKLVGAPWIHAEKFAERLNSQRLPGVHFAPFHYRPFKGSYKEKDCQGVLLVVTDPLAYRPIAVQYLILGMLKTLYPKEVGAKLSLLKQENKDFFCKASGNDEIFTLFCKEKYAAWKLIPFQQEEREAFMQTRKKYLLY